MLNLIVIVSEDNNFTNAGSINADTFSIPVKTNLDYTNRGNITASSLKLNVDGNFSNNDENNNFIWGANNSLVVLGNADITTDNHTQSGVIEVTGALNISAGGDFTNSIGGDISAESLGLTVGNLIQNNGNIDTGILTIDTDAIHNPGSITANTSLTITATNDVFSGGSIITGALNIDANRNFANHGDISTDSFEITGYTAINQGSIVSGSLDLITDDFFRNLTGGDISVDSLNITAGGKVTNTATIDVSGILSITANNDSTRTYDTTGFYVANRGDIQATNFNITAVDNFYNRGDITADTLDIEAKDIFFLNREIDSFYAAGHTYDGGNISLAGDSSFRADGGRIENYGNIDLGDNNLAITAFIFINHSDATIDADDATLNLNVNTFIDAGSITAAINQSN